MLYAKVMDIVQIQPWAIVKGCNDAVSSLPKNDFLPRRERCCLPWFSQPFSITDPATLQRINDVTIDIPTHQVLLIGIILLVWRVKDPCLDDLFTLRRIAFPFLIWFQPDHDVAERPQHVNVAL